MDFTLDRFTIRRKVFKFLGASFHVYDPAGNVVGFTNQKAFKLREDIRVYTDDSMSRELLLIRARQIIDFSAAYDIVDADDGRKLGAARRKGFSSLVRDSWEVLGPQDQLLGTVQEDSTVLALVRRIVANLVPQTFHLRDAQGQELAELRVHFNPFIYRMTVTRNSDTTIDPQLVFGTAVLLAAIEARQN